MRRRVVAQAIGLAATGLLLPGVAAPARAGSIGVSPTRLDLGRARAADSITLTNGARERVLVQVRSYAWAKGAAPEELTETRDVVAVPALVEIAPDARQIVRVARRTAPGGIERAYRVIVSEVPDEIQARGNGVRFAVRLSLPVFVTPDGAVARPRFSAERRGDGVDLHLANDGTAFLRVLRLELVPEPGPEAAAGHHTLDQPAYVLAGERATWPLPGLAAQRLRVRAETSIGPLDVAVPVAAGDRV